MLDTEIVHFLHSPISDAFGVWMSVSRNQWMSTDMCCHHVNNQISIFLGAEGASHIGLQLFPFINCLTGSTFVVGSNVGGGGLVGRVLEVASINAALSQRYTIILSVSLLSQTAFS